MFRLTPFQIFFCFLMNYANRIFCARKPFPSNRIREIFSFYIPSNRRNRGYRVFKTRKDTQENLYLHSRDSHSPVVVVVPEIRKNIKILAEEFF